MTPGLRLAPNTSLVLDGEPHVIAAVDLGQQAVTLVGNDGAPVVVALGWLLDHPGLEAVQGPATEPAARASLLPIAPEHALTKAHKRLQHVREVETGHKSGDPHDGVAPDPRYDPALVPGVIQQRRAKAAELAEPAVDADQRMGYRTLEREAKEWREGAFDNLVDGRSCRIAVGTRLDPRVLDAIEAVVAERRHQSNFQTLDGLAFLVTARVRKDHEQDWPSLLPKSNKTIIRAAQQMYTPMELTKGKAKYRGTKLAPTDKPAPRLLCTRPGQIVLGDVKDLDVLLKNTKYLGTVRGRLIMWMDMYSCSIPEVRVVIGSEKAVDIAQSIRSIGRPKLMEPGWSDDLRWPFVGIPEAIVDEFAGGMTAGVPFMEPENLVIDNGRTYRSFTNVAAARTMGTDVVPARVLRPTDKARIERAFRTLDTLLCQHLQGYRGPDPSERGRDTEARARYVARELEAIIRHWVADVWQRRPLDDDIRPSWGPDHKGYSANALFNYGIGQTGLRLRALTPQEYQETLPAKTLKLHRVGFKVNGLIYDWQRQWAADGTEIPDPLKEWRNPDRRKTPDWGRKHVVKHDDRDLRRVWWQDPRSGKYHPLDWRGAFGLEDVPAFNDKDAEAMLEVGRERRLDPLNQQALAEVLLELLAFHDPNWDGPAPTKRERDAAARREQQAESAAADLARDADRYDDDADEHAEAVAVTHAERHAEMLQDVRRRTRESAGVVGGTAPPVMGSSRTGLFADLDETDDDDAGAGAAVLPLRRKDS